MSGTKPTFEELQAWALANGHGGDTDDKAYAAYRIAHESSIGQPAGEQKMKKAIEIARVGLKIAESALRRYNYPHNPISVVPDDYVTLCRTLLYVAKWAKSNRHISSEGYLAAQIAVGEIIDDQ